MNDEPKRQQIIPGKYFLYSHNILQIRYHVFPFSLISNCHPHYSLSKILTNKLIYILYTVYIAYEPDIILLNQEEEIFESSKASDIDMYIVRKNNMYELYAEDRIGITYNIEDIY